MAGTFSQSQRHLTCFSDGVLTPVTRFRVEPLLEGLGRLGWSGKSIYGYGEFDQKIKFRSMKLCYRFACRIQRAFKTLYGKAEGPVLLQRLAIPNWSHPETTLARRNGKTVFDFDDAIFMNRRHLNDPTRGSALAKIFQAARHVVAGNSWLAEHVQCDTPISVIPTCLDTDRYRPNESIGIGDRPVRVGWMGTSSNYPYLQQLVEPWKVLRQKYGNQITFSICSDEPPPRNLSDLYEEFSKWSPATEIPVLQSFDIGLMPLAMDDWCRGKCSFKLIQYMAVGKPVVCTPVGMNLDVVSENVNGLFADIDWTGPLEALISDATLRQRMGNAARVTVEEHYSLSVAVNAYEKIFLSLL